MKKTCTKCNVARPLSEFTADGKGRGLRSACKACCAAERVGRRDRKFETDRIRYRGDPLRFRRERAAYRDANRALINAYDAERDAKERGSRPPWAIGFFMREAYDLAQRRSAATRLAWQVDHVVPIVSDKVCGLHAHTNLQVIPALENQRKRNAFWPGMPS